MTGQDRDARQNDQEAPQGASQADTVAEQVGQQWTMILRMMTAQGASRGDIIELALVTARTVLTLTAMPLWNGRHKGETPSGETIIEYAHIPAGEEELTALFVKLEDELTGGLAAARGLPA